MNSNFDCWQQDQERKQKEDTKLQEVHKEIFGNQLNASDNGRNAARASQLAENEAALKALRAKSLALPPLPPDRKPLLGRWRIPTTAKPRGGDDLSQLMGMLSNPDGAMCEVVFGGGTTEFKSRS